MKGQPGANIEVGHGVSTASDSFAAGEKATRRAFGPIREHRPCAVLVFASVRHDLSEVLRGVHTVVGDAPVLGSTTAGEICDGVHEGSVAVAVLASPYVAVHCGVGRHVSRDWRAALAEAVGSLRILTRFRDDAAYRQELTRQGKNLFALLFTPGVTRHAAPRSFEVLEEFKRHSLGQIPIFGGASADDWRLEETSVLSGRAAVPDGMLLAVFETELQFGIALHHGFRASTSRVTVTRSAETEVLELDGEPAAERYARLMGSSSRDLWGKHLTLTTGRSLGSSNGMGEYGIKVASFLTSSGGVILSEPVPAGTELTVMEADAEAMSRAGERAVKKAVLRGGITDPALFLTCCCALHPRMMGPRFADQVVQTRSLMPKVPLFGFLSFGEQGVADDGTSRHENAAVSVLALGRQLSRTAYVARENASLQEELRRRMAALETANLRLRQEMADRRRAEEYRSLLAAVIEQAAEVITITDRQGVVQYVNPAFEKVTGYRCREVIGRPAPALFEHVAPEARTSRSSEGEAWRGTLRNRRKDGSVWDSACTVFPVRNGRREITNYVGIEHDLTEQLELETQLRQSQKLEAIGRLAGGVAHDFNNLLTVINGLSELALSETHQDDGHHSRFDEILKAGNRAADLTRQLLAFSRRQVLEPVALNLNDTIAKIEKMVRRLIGEDIGLHVDLDAHIGPVMADPGQVEQILVNLVVNARDAMPHGGDLRIATAAVELDDRYAAHHVDVAPGPYVRLTVSDTGTGMDAETRSRIFEPFFTTKGPDQGTGLGLSTVHGIVSQSGGHISVRSDPGKGTAFEVYLPRVSSTSEQTAHDERDGEPLEGHETILLVEDDASVRRLVKRLLESCGYAVLEAKDPDAALAALAANREAPDLLVTDVVMPRCSGLELADRARQRHPGLKVLYISGYPERAVPDADGSREGVDLLQKPFSRSALVQRVRQLLEAPSRSAEAAG